MAIGPRLICSSTDLHDGGRGLRFTVCHRGRDEPAFAIRHRGTVYGYLNRCAHTPVELDWTEGEFFDADGRWLICATHGAIYDPASGRCVGGRCQGRGLVQLPMIEQGGKVYVVEEKA